jgi:uncharacterized protein (TIGR03083 family)
VALDFVRAIRDDADALANAAESAGVDAQVPSCADWKVADLLEHLGMVHRWAAANCGRAPSDSFVPSTEMGEAPEAPALVAWLREGASDLVAVLESHDASDPCWTWAPPQTVAFWQRRMAHETAMHRVDAQLAAGTAEPISPELAADGIDEWLWLMPRRPWASAPEGSGESLHFHCTDVPGEWVVRLQDSGMEVEHEHAKADLAVRGGASDLLLWMMGRGGPDDLEVFGDTELMPRWRELASF